MNSTNLCDYLIYLRKSRGLKKSHLAEKMGVSLTTIIRYEDPKHERRPSISNVSKLFRVLEATPEEKEKLYKLLLITSKEKEEIEVITDHLLPKIITDDLADLIYSKDFKEILERLLVLNEDKRKEAIKTLLTFMKGFS